MKGDESTLKVLRVKLDDNPSLELKHDPLTVSLHPRCLFSVSSPFVRFLERVIR